MVIAYINGEGNSESGDILNAILINKNRKIRLSLISTFDFYVEKKEDGRIKDNGM